MSGEVTSSDAAGALLKIQVNAAGDGSRMTPTGLSLVQILADGHQGGQDCSRGGPVAVGGLIAGTGVSMLVYVTPWCKRAYFRAMSILPRTGGHELWQP